MDKYHKIQTIYLRDPETNYKTLLEGQWARPEFEYLKDNEWHFTEKVDGTNIRAAWDCVANHVNFKGKTDKAQIPPFLLDKLGQTFTVERFSSLYPDTSMCLYGEGYGARIQKGGGNYIPDGVDFILFDVRVGDIWLRRGDVEDIAHGLGIKVVPAVGRGSLIDAVEMVRQGFKSKVAQADVLAEGLVMRPATELMDRRGHRIITKIKHKDFGG